MPDRFVRSGAFFLERAKILRLSGRRLYRKTLRFFARLQLNNRLAKEKRGKVPAKFALSGGEDHFFKRHLLQRDRKREWFSPPFFARVRTAKGKFYKADRLFFAKIPRNCARLSRGGKVFSHAVSLSDGRLCGVDGKSPECAGH